MATLVAIGRKGLRRLALDSGVLLRLGQLSRGHPLALVVSGTLGLSALLQAVMLLATDDQR